MNVENLVAELKLILEDDEKINSIKNDYHDLFKLLHGSGNASANAAQKINDFLVPQ